MAQKSPYTAWDLYIGGELVATVFLWQLYQGLRIWLWDLSARALQALKADVD